jgi:hypothetical protein
MIVCKHSCNISLVLMRHTSKSGALLCSRHPPANLTVATQRSRAEASRTQPRGRRSRPLPALRSLRSPDPSSRTSRAPRAGWRRRGGRELDPVFIGAAGVAPAGGGQELSEGEQPGEVGDAGGAVCLEAGVTQEAGDAPQVPLWGGVEREGEIAEGCMSGKRSGGKVGNGGGAEKGVSSLIFPGCEGKRIGGWGRRRVPRRAEGRGGRMQPDSRFVC